jgi:hydrogenase maturation protease
MSVASTADPTAPAAPSPGAPGSTLVLGLGNPILGDDGVGWVVAREVAARFGLAWEGHGRGLVARPGIEVDCVAVGGLSLMERLVGWGRVILVDAIHGSGDAPGTVRRRSLAEIPGREASHLDSQHDMPLAVALATGALLGAVLPETIVVVSVEAEHVDRFGEVLSPAVADAVPAAVACVLDALGGVTRGA